MTREVNKASESPPAFSSPKGGWLWGGVELLSPSRFRVYARYSLSRHQRGVGARFGTKSLRQKNTSERVMRKRWQLVCALRQISNCSTLGKSFMILRMWEIMMC